MPRKTRGSGSGLTAKDGPSSESQSPKATRAISRSALSNALSTGLSSTGQATEDILATPLITALNQVSNRSGPPIMTRHPLAKSIESEEVKADAIQTPDSGDSSEHASVSPTGLKMSGALSPRGRKRPFHELDPDLPSSDPEENDDNASDQDFAASPAVKRRREDQGRFLNVAATVGLDDTPQHPIKRGRGRPRVQKSPNSSVNASKATSRLPGRRRNFIDPRVEDGLLRQADLRRRYRVVVKMLKPCLAELADRTVRDLKDDPKAHMKTEEYGVVMKQLSSRFDQNIASQEREFRLSRGEKEKMFLGQQQIIKRNFEIKIEELEEEHLLRCKDEIIRISRLAQTGGNEEATDDEGGYPPRRRRKGTWMDPVTGLSRSGFFVQIERDFADFEAQASTRRAMKHSLKAVAPEAVIDQPADFAVLDKVQREGALASLNLGTLARAAGAVHDLNTKQHLTVLSNSQAIGLQMLATATEQRPSVPATPATAPDAPPPHSPKSVGRQSDAVIPKTPQRTLAAKPSSKPRSRRKPAAKEVGGPNKVSASESAPAKPQRSSGSAYLSNILNADDARSEPPARSITGANGVQQQSPTPLQPSSVNHVENQTPIETSMAGSPAQGPAAIVVKPARPRRGQKAKDSPATPHSRHQSRTFGPGSPSSMRGSEGSVAPGSPVVFSPGLARYHNSSLPPQPNPQHNASTYPRPDAARAPPSQDPRQVGPAGPELALNTQYMQTHPPGPPSAHYHPHYPPPPYYPGPQSPKYPAPQRPTDQQQQFPGPYTQQQDQMPPHPDRRSEAAYYRYYQDGRPAPSHPNYPYPAQHERAQPLPPPPYQVGYYQYPPQYHHPYPPPQGYGPPPPPPPPPSHPQQIPPSSTPSSHHRHPSQPQMSPYHPGPPPPGYPPNMQAPQAGHPMHGAMPPPQPQQLPYPRYQPSGPPEQHPSLRPNFSTSQRRAQDHW